MNETVFLLSFEFTEFPRLVFFPAPLKVSLPRQNDASFIVDNSLKFHFPVMIFLIPAENVCFRNFPAVFTKSGGVVTGGCNERIQESLLLGRRTKGNLAWCFHSFLQVFERGFLQKISYFDGKK